MSNVRQIKGLISGKTMGIFSNQGCYRSKTKKFNGSISGYVKNTRDFSLTSSRDCGQNSDWLSVVCRIAQQPAKTLCDQYSSCTAQ